MDGIAVAIAKNLKFNVARIAKIFFEVDRRIAKGGFCFGPCLLHLGLKLFFAVDDLHAAATATRRRLDDYRISDFARNCFGFGDIFNCAVRARDKRQTQCACRTLGFNLVTHRADMFGLGANPFDIMALNDFRKLRVFRQKTVAGVDGVSMADFRG